MGRLSIVRSIAMLALLVGAGCAAPAPVSTGGAPSARDVARRVSECEFRVVLSGWLGAPDATADIVLDAAAAIARRTGAAIVNGTYGSEEQVNDFQALNAIARRHGERVRELLIARGVVPQPQPAIVLVSHPQASSSGASIRVCAPGRNVENGWRERPLDPQHLVRTRIGGRSGATVLAVPIVNRGPYTWNNIPLAEDSINQFQLDRAEDPESFADVQFRCWQSTGADPVCARRRVSLQVELWNPPPERAAEGGTARIVALVRSEVRAGPEDRRLYLLRRWPEDPSSAANLTCRFANAAQRSNAEGPVRDQLSCDGALYMRRPRLAVSMLGFHADSETEVISILDRVRRDIERFVRDGDALQGGPPT